ncbi:hypothetical protein C0995_005783, partial [Termitomyces sp. Mi166
QSESASPNETAVLLPALENEREEPLLFQAPATPPAPPEHFIAPSPAPIQLAAAPLPKPRPNHARHQSAQLPAQPLPPASPPLALRHSKRNRRPPRDWWVVQHQEPVHDSSDEEEQVQAEPDLGSDLELEPEPLDPGFEDVQLPLATNETYSSTAACCHFSASSDFIA